MVSNLIVLAVEPQCCANRSSLMDADLQKVIQERARAYKAGLVDAREGKHPTPPVSYWKRLLGQISATDEQALINSYMSGYEAGERLKGG